MVVNSKVIPFAELENEAMSIIDITGSVISFYKKLGSRNDAFTHIFIVAQKKPLYESIDVNSDMAIEQLAEEILSRNIDDIIKIDMVEDPDLNYIRLGKYIHFSLGTEISGEPFLTLSFSFIQSDHAKSKIGTIGANGKCFEELEDCIYFIEKIKDSFPTNFASMKMSFFDRVINNEIRKYKFPLGLVTFFSNEECKNIPSDLPQVDYTSVDGGMLLVLRDANVFDDGVEVRHIVLRILNLMQQIEKVYPAYSKRFTPVK